ncbi:hypothetical protein [Fluviispira multicolorata]|uniref:Uncharacterized protein n=1 Tax=Fluviispira multicolorata TaxID=2654512 RepID=A0A833JB86_9BACT|nr:hypothetical protein [Fluviispira multicolorata]KAB8028125.1 hypothetical protein GCL57_13835 [Fluviispira multicolorata]
MKNLFQLRSSRILSQEPQSGAKIIQFRDHKHKAADKKLKHMSSRSHGDSLARNIKTHSNQRAVVKTRPKIEKKTFQGSSLFYALALAAILFGIFMLLGGFSVIFK